jgi:limonene-1,2-epoxide hydrolase
MPWFPDFTSAMVLARQETREAGQADPVRQYIAALNSGDISDLESVWPGEVVIYDPRFGEVRGHRRLRHFLGVSHALLAERHARVDTVVATVSPGRAVVELLAHLDPDGGSDGDGQEVLWPAAVVAESRDDRSVVFRSYFSRQPVDGRRDHTRPAFLTSAADLPGDVVARFHAALSAGDTDAVVSTFAPDGYYRESAGPRATHRGPAELRAFFTAQFSAGGTISLEPCATTDDGVRCAVEYNCRRWGSRELPPQAGLCVCERGPDGVLAAVREYADLGTAG